MLKDVNDCRAEARELVRLLARHSGQGQSDPVQSLAGRAVRMFERGGDHRFGDIVNAAGYASPVRTPRGRDILAACGQLKSDSIKLKKSERAKAEALG